jgi:hypothetical protein
VLVVSWGEGPHEPSAFFAGVGKGRFLRTGQVAILERLDGAGWREVARFRSVRGADRALDDAVADGASPDSLRVVESYPASNRILVIGGMITIGAAIAIILYVAFG